MHRPELCFKQPLAKGLIPLNRTVPVRPRSYASNMGLRNALSNTLRLSPMPGAALSTTLLDPLQWPSACNWTALAMRTRETHYDVQITLDAQETTRFKQHPPSLRAQEKLEIRVYGRGHSSPRGGGFAHGPSKLPWGPV